MAGIAVTALALASCSSDDDDSSDSSSSSSDSSDSSDSSAAGDDTSSDDSSSEDSGSGDGDLVGAPDGFDLTDPGSHLKNGESAYVVTQQAEYEGETFAQQYWKITARDSTEKASGEIPLDDEDAADVDHFICMNYDVEFPGQGEASDPESYQLVTEPDMGAVDDDGNGANYILMGGSEDCDIPEADLLPSDAGELETGKVYRGAVRSWESKSDDGITPTGLSFTYDVESAALDDVDDILWN